MNLVFLACLCNKPGYYEAYGDEEKQTQIFSFNKCIGKRNMKSEEKIEMSLKEIFGDSCVLYNRVSECLVAVVM